MKKLTNVLALEMVLGMEEVKANKELMEKLEVMKAQFEKKNKSTGEDGKKSLTKAQMENEKIKELVLEVLGKYEEPKMIKELQSENPEIGTEKYSNQKMSALLKQMVGTGTVVRTEVKGKAYFQIA